MERTKSRARVLATSVGTAVALVLATAHAPALAAWAVQGTSTATTDGADLQGPSDLELECAERGDDVVLTVSLTPGSSWAAQLHMVDDGEEEPTPGTSVEVVVPKTPSATHSVSLWSRIGSWTTPHVTVAHEQSADGGCDVPAPDHVSGTAPVVTPGAATSTATVTSTVDQKQAD